MIQIWSPNGLSTNANTRQAAQSSTAAALTMQSGEQLEVPLPPKNEISVQKKEAPLTNVEMELEAGNYLRRAVSRGFTRLKPLLKNIKTAAAYVLFPSLMVPVYLAHKLFKDPQAKSLFATTAFLGSFVLVLGAATLAPATSVLAQAVPYYTGLQFLGLYMVPRMRR